MSERAKPPKISLGKNSDGSQLYTLLESVIDPPSYGAAAVNVEMKKMSPQSASRPGIPRVVGARYIRGKTAMNKKKIYKWLYKKAADAIGEEELESLKNDLVNPVKIAAKEALDDIISDYNNGPGDD